MPSISSVMMPFHNLTLLQLITIRHDLKTVQTKEQKDIVILSPAWTVVTW
jgi:hypothetical protein